MTSRAAGRYVAERVRDRLRGPEERLKARRDAQIAQARDLAEKLSRLKGAAMKVGQQAAMLAAQLDMPEEVQAALGKLHSQAEPVPFPLIRAALEAELEGPLTDHFATVDEQPLGTASLAQAHAATLPDGAQVVVKVLHEGVRESVKADLMAVRAMLLGGRALGRNAEEMNDMFEEAQVHLLAELDYYQEAVHLQLFADAFGSDPRFRIPRHHPRLCTDRVLVMDRLYGQTVAEFAKTAGPEERHRAGMNIAEAFLEMTFTHRVLHADPHPGNYLIEPDGRLGLIDFGCVKRFDPFWIGRYARLVRSALDEDEDGILQAARDLDAWRGEDPGAARVILAFCEEVLAPLRGQEHIIGGPGDQIVERVNPIIQEMWKYPEIRGPRNLLFLHRTLGGLYMLVRPLQVKARWDEVLRPYLDAAIAAADAPRV
jgi:predicted unusual protein kinase regulating ubiquinone biosynthesis (AarF/ABC1/UbiB family)